MAVARTLDDVVAQLKKNKARNRSCALLMGAGCSVQAGIPLARGFVEEIRQRYPGDYEHAAEKTYPHCMAELSSADRHDLISEFIDKAKINWAHISIAQLMRGGYVDRVLTTNFDPLVMRACALVNLFPAVYDMAVVRDGFLSDFVRDRAVFHLHGQRDGFVQLHREEDVEALAKVIKPLFDDTAHDRTWLVVGYSGANDPVFRVLADRPHFPNRLFWVGYRSDPPSAAVKAALLDTAKDAYWISDYDPDNFLVQLAAKLGCFPPGFFAKPFSHLLECYATLAGFRLPGEEVDLDWAARGRGWIREAISRFEEVAVTTPPPPPPAAPAAPGPFGIAIARRPLQDRVIVKQVEREENAKGGIIIPDAAKEKPQEGEVIGNKDDREDLLIMQSALESLGLDAAEPGPTDVVGEAWTALITGDYDKVLALRASAAAPHLNGLAEPITGAYFGRAKSLSRLARTKTGAEAEALFQEAVETYQRALEMKPQDHVSLANLGNTFFRWAQTKEGTAAADLLAKAEDMLTQAEAIRPGVAAYRLARVAAFRGEEQKCLDWLAVALDHQMLPSRAYLENDAELSAVHANPGFQAFLDRLEAG